MEIKNENIIYSYKNAFTFVELVVSIWIILLVSTIAYISYSGSLEKKDNTKVSSDLATIDNALKSYLIENKTLPNPSGNNSFYKIDGSYSHGNEADTYWVSGFFGEQIIPKKYFSSLPLDPRTGYYYAYARTINNNYYEIAWIEKKDNNYKAIVSGNYPVKWTELFDLVKEYNWPEFVGDNSTEHFPYNPEEKILTASIYDYSGSVTVIHNNQNINWTWILNIPLVTGDKIIATQNSTASIYFSDGSKSSLGDSSKTSELVLANMEYKEKNNLFTKVKLLLNVWTIWTSASKMGSNSDFEVYSNDTVAAVRWTVFWVTVSPSSWTNVVVVKWDVEVSKITDTSINQDQLISDLKSNTEISYTPITSPSSVVTSSWHIIVTSTELPKWLQIINWWIPSSSTWAINEIPGTQENKDSILIWWSEWNEESIYLDIQELTNSWTNYDNFNTKIWVSDKILKKFDYFKLNNTDTLNFTSLWITWTWVYTLTWWTLFNKIFSNQLNWANSNYIIKEALKSILASSQWKFELIACKITKKWEKCSKSKNFTVWEKMTFIEPEIVETPVLATVTDNTNTIITPPIPLTVIFGNETITNNLASNWYNLIGYAGYNIADYSMIIAGKTIHYASWDSINSCLPSLSWTTFNNNSCTDDTTKEYLRHPLLNSSFTKNSSFNIWTNYWIFLDNAGSDDFLKYNIWDLLLNTSTWFAIEMNVRGAALKRLNQTYTLFNFSNWLWLKLENWNISLFTGNSWKLILWNSINIGTTDYDKFFKIIVYAENNKVYVSIPELLLNSDYLNFTNTSFSDMYIWSNSSKTNQWNDMIDYVKIYKK